jgi:hypothetical protein
MARKEYATHRQGGERPLEIDDREKYPVEMRRRMSDLCCGHKVRNDADRREVRKTSADGKRHTYNAVLFK